MVFNGEVIDFCKRIKTSVHASPRQKKPPYGGFVSRKELCLMDWQFDHK